MKKILYAFLIIAVWYSGFSYISLAQDEPPAIDPLQQDNSKQDMDDMIRLLEELQTDEERGEESLLPKNKTEKTKAPDDPMAIFSQPEERVQPSADPLPKNAEENIFETSNEAITINPVDPARTSKPSNEPATGKAGQLNEIENSVNAMLKALEELENSGKLSEVIPYTPEETDNIDAPDSLNQVTKPANPLVPDKNRSVGKSIEKTDEVVRLDPNGPDSHFQNGLVYWKSQNFDAAIHEFQEVIRLAPENAHAYWNLGLLYDKTNRGTEAMAHLKKAESIYSKYDYPEFAQDTRNRLKSFSEKYGRPLLE